MKLQGRVVWITGASSGISVTMLVLGGIRTNISVNALHGDGTPHGSMDSIQTAGIDADTCAERIIKVYFKKM
ncbi:MAG: hypothetical protein K9L75_04350 [Spirochaetia bacterium]|nr:hypothetical protein [Spirochaetia bacterium]